MGKNDFYNEILEMLNNEAELGKYVNISEESMQELFMDFSSESCPGVKSYSKTKNDSDTEPTITNATAIPITKFSGGNYKKSRCQHTTTYEDRPLNQSNANKQIGGKASATVKQETKPIVPVNIDLSSLTAENICTEQPGRTPTYTGSHFTIGSEGNPYADLMFMGESQGRGYDQIKGQPSQLLTKMIAAMGYSRETVFISDIFYSVPIDKPETIENELGICIAYLNKQISIVKPKVIVFLGPLPLRLLLNKRGISKHRGEWLEYMGVKIMPTYHPALLLRETQRDPNSQCKRETWNDLQLVMSELKGQN